MKKIYFLFVAVLSIVFISCEGDSGPPGPPGLPGNDGITIVAQSFETPPLNFLFENNYEQTVFFPDNIDIQDNDMILVYLLWAENPDNWRLLPQTIYTDNGQFQYNFQDNFTDISIFLDAPSDFDFNSLLPGDTLNQIFRIVVLPVDLINNSNIDVTNLNSVMELGNITHFEKLDVN